MCLRKTLIILVPFLDRTLGFLLLFPSSRSRGSKIWQTKTAVHDDVDLAESSIQIVDRVEEDSRFLCDPSVKEWRNLVSEGDTENFNLIRQETMAKLSDCMRGQLDRAYWSSSALRSLFFGLNALGSNLLVESGSSLLSQMDRTFRVYELLKCYEQELEFVKMGTLKYPWDFVTQENRVQLDHRQANPIFFLPQSLTLLQEARDILRRRKELKGRPSEIWLDREATEMYPNYYLNDFHYQTDGWLSSESADRYELSSEAIFIGSQDVMQRQTIVPIVRYDTPKSILEVACGTGRFATFLRDQFPLANYTLTDLSPFYLKKAQENDEYWRRYRGQASASEEGTENIPVPARVVQANAESLSFPDNSFDCVVCVYLFHELPVPARRKAAQEMARVVRPGGQVVLSDSIQVGDRDEFGRVLEKFTNFNEPHYVSYVYDDLGKYFEEAGLKNGEKLVNSRTKTLSFTKGKARYFPL